MKKEIDSIKALVFEGKTNEAITILEKVFLKINNLDLLNEYIIIGARLQNLNKEERIGIITKDDASKRKKRINKSLLKLLIKIDNIIKVKYSEEKLKLKKENWLKLILSAKLEHAIDDIIKFSLTIKNYKILERIAFQSSRLNLIETKNNQSISYEEYNVQRNKVTKAVLDIINDIN